MKAMFAKRLYVVVAVPPKWSAAMRRRFTTTSERDAKQWGKEQPDDWKVSMTRYVREPWPAAQVSSPAPKEKP